MRNAPTMSGRVRARRAATVAMMIVLGGSGVLVSHSYSVADRAAPAREASAPPASADTPVYYFPSQYELHAPEPGPHIEAF